MTKNLPKNLSFKNLILVLSAATFLIFLLAFLLQFFLSQFINQWIAFAFSFLLGGVTCYFFIFSTIDFYLRRRIKLIYKMIRLSKTSQQAEEVPKNKDQDSMTRVESEVSHWIEEQQKEIQSLKDLENYRKNFLGNISHELKTPIFAVQGYVHTLLDGGLHDPTINKRFLKKAAQNIERLETIVEDLDIIARLEEATLQLEISSFDLKTLTLEVIEQVEVQAKKRDIKIVFKSGADRVALVKADREYIRTVLINLIVNSIKYGREGGVTKIGFYDLDNEILVEIADNGIGIENKHLKHLFDRFYRVDKSRSRDRGGSGLGLSIVKHIIEAHKETINVKSKPGDGTTLSFTLTKA
jgi:two-component system phosphate regulon sensor histidine kinase PhoR